MGQQKVRGGAVVLRKKLQSLWSGLWLRQGGGIAVLVVLLALVFRLEQVGNIFAQAPWTVAVWMPTPGQPEPSGQPTVPADLPPTVRAFVRLALPSALEAHQALRWQTSVVLAQWGLEHGWQVPDAQGYNWGNTTFAPGCMKRGRFCYAPTPQEGLREYVYTAQLHFYDGVRAAVSQGADAVAVALGKSLWDEGHYGGAAHPGSSLLALLRQFNLYRLDRT